MLTYSGEWCIIGALLGVNMTDLEKFVIWAQTAIEEVVAGWFEFGVKIDDPEVKKAMQDSVDRMLKEGKFLGTFLPKEEEDVDS